MKNIFKIFFRDIKSVISNWVALIIILGLIILPSLYAWFNIRAGWDPYGNTKGIQIAIVNNDNGGSIQDKKINIGDELVGKLKENTLLGWNFVSEEEGRNGVEKGKYYATIIIPKEFTEETLSIINKNLKRPTLKYIVNLKSNAIAPKITDKGISTIKSQIDSNIIKTVDGIIFKITNEIGIGLEGSKDKILKIFNGIMDVNQRMPEIEKVINEAYIASEKADNLVLGIKNNIPLIQETLNISKNLLADTKVALEKSKEGLKELSPVIKVDLEFIQTVLSELDSIIDGLSNISIDKDVILKGLDSLILKINTTNEKISGLINILKPLSNLNSNLNLLISDLESLSVKLESANKVIADIKGFVANNEPVDNTKWQELKDLVSVNKSIVDNILNNFDGKYIPFIKKAINEMDLIVDNSIRLIGEAERLNPDIESLLSKLDNGLKLGRGDLDKLINELPNIKNGLSEISTRLSVMNDEEKINYFLDLLINDWEELSDFLSSPVKIEEEALFSIPNYGSAMSPFYSTLALWVGALILVSLLTTNVHESNEKDKFKAYEKYFGKLLTFCLIGVFQSIVLTLGDIYLLKTYVLNKWIFMGIGFLSSIIFILIVYTLVSVFGNVGKAIGVILLVIQVAGSGGTFPVEVMTNFFRKVNPLLPFTYSISAMREAVAGIVRENLIKDITILLIYGCISILIGLALKGPINKMSKKFIDKLNESGLVGH